MYKYLVSEGGFLYPLVQNRDQLTNQNETDQMDLKIKVLFRKLLNDVIVVRVFFKELGIIKYSKDELYGVADAIGKRLLIKILGWF